jgi:hypothetical protein
MAGVKLEWWAKMHDLTPDQVRRALETMTVGQDAWPPGPRAFRKLALAGDEATERRGIHALYLPSPPTQPVSRERVLSDLASLKGILPVDAPAVEDAAVKPISQADRRAYIARHREALMAAGLGRFIPEADLSETRAVA